MVELADLPGVGEKTAEKLRDAGFADMMRLATATPKELSVKQKLVKVLLKKLLKLLVELKTLISKLHWKLMKEEKM